MITQCANSACRTSFDYQAGGKFFRFHLTETELSVSLGATHNLHNVVHYWLCPICSKMFTLVHVDTAKVVLLPASQDFEVAGPRRRINSCRWREDHEKDGLVEELKETNSD